MEALMDKDKTFKINREYHDKLCRIRDQGRFGNLKNTAEVIIDHWLECEIIDELMANRPRGS